MAVTTIRELVDAVAAVEVTGVRRDYGTNRPTHITTTPCKFLRLVSLEVPRTTLGNKFHEVGGLLLEVIIPMQSLSQSLDEINFLESVDMAVNLRDALVAADVAGSWPGQGVPLRIYIDHVLIGGTFFWSVIARVACTA